MHKRTKDVTLAQKNSWNTKKWREIDTYFKQKTMDNIANYAIIFCNFSQVAQVM